MDKRTEEFGLLLKWCDDMYNEALAMTCDRRIGPYPCCSVVEGDCLALMKALGDGAVDAVVSDPPYRHAHLNGSGFSAAREFYAGGKIDDISNFDLEVYASELFRMARIVVAFHSRDLVPDYAAAARVRGWSYDLHAWFKTNAIPFCCNTWKSDLEYIAVMWIGKKNMLRGLDQAEYSKLFIGPLQTDKQHPTQKPLEVMSKYIRILQPETILDPFCGSGTTLVAAKKLGRHFLGFEISPEYCAIARRRLAEIDAQPSLFEPQPEQMTL